MARAGLAKALGREWSDCRARVVSLDASLDAETAAEKSAEPTIPSATLEAFRLKGNEPHDPNRP